jgi:hypothetical protein
LPTIGSRGVLLCCSFARIRCPTIGNLGDVQFSLNIKVSSMEPINASPLAVGGLPTCYGTISSDDAALQYITLEFTGNEPSEEALSATAFESGAIKFLPAHQSYAGVDEASILQ